MESETRLYARASMRSNASKSLWTDVVGAEIVTIAAAGFVAWAVLALARKHPEEVAQTTD